MVSLLGTEFLSFDSLLNTRKILMLVKMFVGNVAFSTMKQQTARSMVLLKEKIVNGEPCAWTHAAGVIADALACIVR